MTDKKNVFSFIWKIKNFSMLPHQFDEELISQTFLIDSLGKTNYYLSLWPRGMLKVDFFSIFLCEQKEGENLKLNYTFTLESTDPMKKISKKIENSETGYGIDKFIKLSDLFSNKQLYLPQDTLTLRCDISPIEEPSAELVVDKEPKPVSTFFKKSIVFCTSIEVEKRFITWSIKNITKITQLLQETSITTPYLKLTMAPNKKGIPGDDDTQILIQQTSRSSEEENLFVKCKFTLISAHADNQAFEESTHLFNLDISDVWTFPPFLTTSVLMDKNNLFEDDTLTILCEFDFSYQENINHYYMENYMPLNFKTGRKSSQLSTCFKNIYADGKFCDIELKADGKTFPYYKVFLCSRSSVFAAMFDNDMKEKNSNVVEIDDVDADTVQRMLMYMHSDVLEGDLSPEDISKLYAAADKYDIESLKQKCAAMLMSKLSVGSVCEILTLADDHQDELLMNAACEFISSYAKKVFHSTHWQSFMGDRLKLASRVMHQILKTKFEI